jgi:hypothetical protein
MNTGRIPLRRVEPQRLLHQQGEVLLRRDFADQATQDDQLRWWHTRALHNTWGIVEGLNVSGVEPGKMAALSAGVALDIFGRELVLEAPLRVQIPETADEYLLVLTYDRTVTECDPSSDLCIDPFVAASGVRLVWMLRRAFTPAHGVPLAILNEDDTCPPPFARHYVRPLARPKVGHGALTVSSREFVPWRIKPNKELMQIGWQFPIDTSAAGFSRTPYYFVEIAIPVPDASPAAMLAVGRYHLTEAERDQFAIRYFFSSFERDKPERRLFDGLSSLSKQRFVIHRGLSDRATNRDVDIPIRISWIGIEPRREADRTGIEVQR